MSQPAHAAKRRITIERVFKATIEDVWELWTSKEGIESWWGPEGFSVKVHKLDLRPGGKMLYAMSASAPETIAFMKNAGMPTTTESLITFTEVSPPNKLVYDHVVDFVPGVAPYDVSIQLELRAEGKSVRLLLTIDAMHDEEWTQRAVMGWEMELGKLAKILQARENA